jgi:hypothetical protein
MNLRQLVAPNATVRDLGDTAARAWARLRRGRTGEWQSRFTRELHEAFAQEVDDKVLRAFGYEPVDLGKVTGGARSA